MRYKSFIPSGIIPDRVKTNNMETKQTAVQWFLDKLPHSIETQFSEQIQEALQMEREQIIEAANNGCKGMCMIDTSRDGKNYYNEIYGGQDEK
jgi:hypothetical protein